MTGAACYARGNLFDSSSARLSCPAAFVPCRSFDGVAFPVRRSSVITLVALTSEMASSRGIVHSLGTRQMRCSHGRGSEGEQGRN